MLQSFFVVSKAGRVLQAVESPEENPRLFDGGASGRRIYAYVNNDPFDNVDPRRLSPREPVNVARWRLLGAAVGGVCAVTEPCGVGMAIGTATVAGAIIISNQQSSDHQSATPPASRLYPSYSAGQDYLVDVADKRICIEGRTRV